MKKYLFISLLVLAGTLTLAQDSLFFVFLNTNPDRYVLSQDSVNKLQEGHIANIEKLHDEGKLLAAGSLDGGGGIFILKAQSFDKVNDYIKTDPAIQANRFILEKFPAKIKYGELCKVADEYNLGSFAFIRLSPFPVEIDLGKTSKEINQEHLHYWRNIDDSTSLLLEIEFINNNGGVMFINTGDVKHAENIFQDDPYILFKKYAYEIKPLWIAEETFCISQ